MFWTFFLPKTTRNLIRPYKLNIQVHVQPVIPIPILAETTAAKITKKKTILHEMALFATGVKSKLIAPAAKETNGQNVQIHHVNQVCDSPYFPY